MLENVGRALMECFIPLGAVFFVECFEVVADVEEGDLAEGPLDDEVGAKYQELPRCQLDERKASERVERVTGTAGGCYVLLDLGAELRHCPRRGAEKVFRCSWRQPERVKKLAREADEFV